MLPRRCLCLVVMSTVRVITLPILLFCVAGGPAHCQFTPFTLGVKVRTGDTIAGRTLTSLGTPALNNNEQIVFQARFDDGLPGCGVTRACEGIFTPTALLMKSGDIFGGQTLTGIFDPNMNDAGTFAFFAGTESFTNGLQGIFSQNLTSTDAELVAQPGDVINGDQITSVSAGAVDDSGRVVFAASFRTPDISVGSGIFTKITPLLKTGDNVAGRLIGGVGGFSMSPEGVLAIDTFASPIGGIFNGTGGVILSLKDLVDGHSLEGFTWLSVNDSGTVVYEGLFDCDSSPSGCLRAVATQYHLLAKEGDMMGGFPIADCFATAINDKGAIAFVPRIGPNTASFLLYSTELGVVAKPGDVIGGLTLASVDYHRISLNYKGEVAFLGTFTDGSQAIILASPVADTTPPVIVPAISGTLGNNGWYISNVTVNWNVSDPESGIASSSGCGPTSLMADTAGSKVTCSATNGVGLSSSVSVTIKIDKTPPVISGMPAPGCTIWPPNHKLVQVAAVSAADALSGLARGSFTVTGTSNSGNPGDILISGGIVQLRADKGNVYTITASASDIAGNVATATAMCTVPQNQGK
jgi:hypothetical protein